MFCTAFALLLSVSPAAAKLPAVSTPHIQRADAANVSALPSPGAKDHSEDWRVFDFVTVRESKFLGLGSSLIDCAF